MLIGVISDTHDRLPMIEVGVRLYIERQVQAVIHAGDFVAPFAVAPLLKYHGPIYATFGNNDGERAGLKRVLPQVVDGPLRITLDGKRILVHHALEWCAASELDWADVVITGHTHEVVNRVDGGKLFLNPGECCGWVKGRCTVAILDTDGPSAEVFDLES